jgi:hypothetical protein
MVKLIDYDAMAKTHESLRRGLVWCRKCGFEQSVSSAYALKHGWPMHCGRTMTIDHPDTWSKSNA